MTRDVLITVEGSKVSVQHGLASWEAIAASPADARLLAEDVRDSAARDPEVGQVTLEVQR